MKTTILMITLILSSICANANTNFSHLCKTENNKNVEVAYSDHGSFSLNRVVIDGATYTDNSFLTVTSKGVAMVYVSNFRNGETLQLVIQAQGNSYYRLQDNVRPLNCRSTTDSGNSSSNNDI